MLPWCFKYDVMFAVIVGNLSCKLFFLYPATAVLVACWKSAHATFAFIVLLPLSLCWICQCALLKCSLYTASQKGETPYYVHVFSKY